MKFYPSTFIAIKNIKELTHNFIAETMRYEDIDFCAIYLRQQRYFCLADIKSNILLKIPEKIHPYAEFITHLKERNIAIRSEYLPNLVGTPLSAVVPFKFKEKLIGFMLVRTKNHDILDEIHIDLLTLLSKEFSLTLATYYFEEYQRTMEEKYKLLIEKERLASAFQISEAYRHELGNILSIISLASDNLTFENENQPSRQDIEEVTVSISQNVKKAQGIFKAITAYNENTKTQMHNADLKMIMEDIINTHTDLLNQNYIKFESKLHDGLMVSANNNLKDALVYLLKGSIDAISYYEPEERYILVSLKKNGNFTLLEISDTGKDVTSNTAYKGVGIERGSEGGLMYFIARKTIVDHGGTFNVVSYNNGKGTTFKINLPLSVANELISH